MCPSRSSAVRAESGHRTGRPAGRGWSTWSRSPLSDGPFAGESREGDRLVRSLRAALVKASNGVVGQNGQTGVRRRAVVQDTGVRPGLALVTTEAHRHLLALLAGRVGEQQ